MDLFGWSRGAIYAIELAKRLQKRGIKVRFLGLIDPCDVGSDPGNLPRIPRVPRNIGRVGIPSSVENFFSAIRAKDIAALDRLLFEQKVGEEHRAKSIRLKDYLSTREFPYSHEDMGFSPAVLQSLIQAGKGCGLSFGPAIEYYKRNGRIIIVDPQQSMPIPGGIRK